jgi:hypothetical protein
MPLNIRCCTDIPLIDAILIESFIQSILYILIGMGNALAECLLEWVEEHKEKLSTRKTEAQNTTIVSKSQHDTAKAQ